MRLFSNLLLLALAMPVAAQDREIRSANLPPALERELLRMYEGTAVRYDGPATIKAGETIRGDVVAYAGPLHVAGRVEGNVAMVDGDVVLEPGGSVAGKITVVGGEVIMGPDVQVAGTITAYRTPTRRSARDRARGDEEGDWDDWWDRRRRDDRWDRGHSRLTVRTGASYNRVEGLPVMFGPVIRTAGPNPLRLEALAIWRSESGASLDTDRMGYRVEAEQFFGGRRAISAGASAFSVVDPLDPWAISDLEASLAAAVFHQDHRDYYQRTGWSLFVRGEPMPGLEARVEYRREGHDALAAGDPWALFQGDATWRYQPLIAEGDLRLLAGSLELDRRDDRDDPIYGWYGRAAVERPVGGSLTRPALLAVRPADDPEGGAGVAVPAADFGTDFTSASLDLRRYTPVGHGSQLNMRVMAGGSLTGKALPPQFQHALGGVGTLPGFATFQADCGARNVVGTRADARFFPSYGCDRFALAQVEYRGGLSLDFGLGDSDYHDDWWRAVDIDVSPTWVVFFDAGRGWAYSDPVSGGDHDTGALFDAGLGFLIDKLGIYAALPLNGDVEQSPRFFLRWGRRF